MAKAIFYHKPDSIYEDDPARTYHFPKRYLSRVQQTVGDWIAYYGPAQNGARGYWGIGRVMRIRPDMRKDDHYFADIEHFMELDRLVLNSENGGFERQLFNSDGTINAGRAVQAVRVIADYEYAQILEAGLSQEPLWPERFDEIEECGEDNQNLLSGFEEVPQAEFERPIVSQLLNTKFRDRKFRQNILIAYDRTCAFTGLRLINGMGRPEVEAAHIVPVEKNGTDSIRNGIALTGTMHWMFDRGMLSLADDYRILTSRHLNHDVSHMLRANGIALMPPDVAHRPHPDYLAWHRENCFKH